MDKRKKLIVFYWALSVAFFAQPVIMQALVFHQFGTSTPGLEDFFPSRPYVPMLLVAAVALMAAYFIPKGIIAFLKKRDSSISSNPEKMLRAYVAPYFLFLMLISSFSFVGFAIAFLEHNPWKLLPFGAIVIIVNILKLPSEKKVASEFGLSQLPPPPTSNAELATPGQGVGKDKLFAYPMCLAGLLFFLQTIYNLLESGSHLRVFSLDTESLLNFKHILASADWICQIPVTICSFLLVRKYVSRDPIAYAAVIAGVFLKPVFSLLLLLFVLRWRLKKNAITNQSSLS